MKTYTITLKGTKKNNTQDITVEVLSNNIPQAFNWLYTFFEKGEFRQDYKGNDGIYSIEKFIPNAKELIHLKGLYFVPKSGISQKK